MLPAGFHNRTAFDRKKEMTNKIKRIRTGGQTGVDRAALDTARKYGIEICGWCPKGGWAEDCPLPPGLLADYPELRETPSAGTSQRTRWNMRDTDAIPEGRKRTTCIFQENQTGKGSYIRMFTYNAGMSPIWFVTMKRKKS